MHNKVGYISRYKYLKYFTNILFYLQMLYSISIITGHKYVMPFIYIFKTYRVKF